MKQKMNKTKQLEQMWKKKKQQSKIKCKLELEFLPN
jgi:hypothetical protein